MYISTDNKPRGDTFRVLIVEDHPLYGDALQSALEQAFPEIDVGRAQSLKETLTILDHGFSPELIIFDLKLPDVTGVSGFHKLKEHAASARVLVVSSLASSELVRVLISSGADGFLPKDAPSTKLKTAIKDILDGKHYVPSQFSMATSAQPDDEEAFRSNPELSALTTQQRRILKLICAGKPNKQIAYEMSLAEATVKAHITVLLRRLGVHNRTQAVVAAEAALMRHGNGAPEAQAYLNH